MIGVVADNSHTGMSPEDNMTGMLSSMVKRPEGRTLAGV